MTSRFFLKKKWTDNSARNEYGWLSLTCNNQVFKLMTTHQNDIVFFIFNTEKLALLKIDILYNNEINLSP